MMRARPEHAPQIRAQAGALHILQLRATRSLRLSRGRIHRNAVAIMGPVRQSGSRSGRQRGSLGCRIMKTHRQWCEMDA
jgi:hypothetical protein